MSNIPLKAHKFLWLTSLAFTFPIAPMCAADSSSHESLLTSLSTINVDGFEPHCELAADGLDLFRDPEFDQQNLQVTWQVNPEIDKDGNVLKHGSVSVAPLDPITGKFLLEEVQTVRRAKPVRITITNNGPEWGYSQRGSEVFYTAYTTDEKTTRIGKLYRNKNGNWKHTFLPNSRRKARPEPSKNPLDKRPKVYYSTMIGKFGGGDVSKGSFGWREDRWYFPIDTELPDDFGTGRWMPDSRELFHRVNQSKFEGYLSLYDTVAATDAIVAPELTWYIGLGTWSAPELDGETAIMAATANADEERIDLVVWAQNDQGDWVEWTRIITFDSLPDLGSPEAFVVDGRSYVLMTSSTEPSPHITSPSVVWITSVDPDLPENEMVRRVVSKEFLPDEMTAKADPEYVILPDGGVKVYYIDKGLKDDPLLVCDTGL